LRRLSPIPGWRCLTLASAFFPFLLNLTWRLVLLLAGRQQLVSEGRESLHGADHTPGLHL
jgi:hypothetical protein